MSIGYTSPINGSNQAFAIYATDPKSAGGAIRGWMPPVTQNVDKRYPEFEQIRFTLKQAWNTTYPSQLNRNGLKQSITTPFRAVNNAGDLLSRENFTCGGTCQSVQSRPNIKGIKGHLGAVQATCVPSVIWSQLQTLNNIPAAACNVKYVYDSSDYVTYLKQKAMNKNFNDRSFGGDDYKTSQSAIRHIRRY
jgi:hypothetical protein